MSPPPPTRNPTSGGSSSLGALRAQAYRICWPRAHGAAFTQNSKYFSRDMIFLPSYLLSAGEHAAHLAAAEELLLLAGRLAAEQQHVVRRAHLSLA